MNQYQCRKHFVIICIITSLILNFKLSAQSFPNIRFVPLSTDILPSNEVRKLYQDTDGYIWIPTYNGLARYDGYGSILYGIRDISHGEFNTYVNVVCEDLQNNIWVGTELGIYRLDKQTGMIMAGENPELINSNISVILCNSNGDLWVGSNTGLYCKKFNENKFTHIEILNSVGEIVKSITSIVKDNKQNLWIAAFDQGLIRYNLQEKRVYYLDDPILRKAHVVACDSKDNIWIGTWGNGLARLINPYASDSVRFLHYSHNKNDKNSLLDDIIYAIEEDFQENTIWIGSRSGLSILHDEHNPSSFQNFLPGNNIDNLPYNEVNSILQTNDGLMWIGMLGGGVCKSTTTGTKFEVNPLDNIKALYNTSSIQSLYYDGDGDFWFGLLDFGLLKYNMLTGEIIDYKNHPELKHLPYTSTINVIAQRDESKEIYFGTQNAGIWIYNKETGSVKQINRFTQTEFKDDCVISLCEDSFGNMWVGTRNGVYVETKDGDFYTINRWLSKNSPLDYTRVYDMCYDKFGNVWIATNGQGIVRIKTDDKTWHQYQYNKGMTANQVYCLQADSSGCVWAGTVSDGLAVYVPSEGIFKPVNGFPNLNNKGVINLNYNPDGQMWITTNNAVFSFTPDGLNPPQNINTYVISADMPSFFFNRNASAKLDDGRVVFGGSKGLMLFTDNPSENHKLQLPIVLTDFRVHNHSLRALPVNERKGISNEEINYSDKLILTHKQNNFYIEFSLLSYINPKDHIFKYQLEGVDKEYIVVDSHHRFASYSNLPAGKYIFHLQAAGEDGVWSSNERTLNIHVLPAPWLTWWAWLIYSLLFIAAIYAVIRFLRYRFRLEKEVHHSNLERQKTEELNHTKLKFFTNITHELMTPLTILITSIQNLRYEKGDPEMLYDVMSNNATRLMRLIQQVLEFRKVESGNLKIKVAYGDITYFVRKCMESFSPLVAQKSLKLYYKSSSDDILGWFDSDKLDKIIYNLLSNASKYTPEKGEIIIKLDIEDNSNMSLTVSNTGELMSEETINGLFKRFYDGKYREFQTIGTGIGLSLVKDLTDIHKGVISVTSNIETGNSFIISLPINKESYSDDEISDESISIAQKESYTEKIVDLSDLTTVGNNKFAALSESEKQNTILVVDDNEELLLLISNLLTSYFNIETAANGLEALEKLKTTSVDLIISDIMMPEMDGITLCKKIKETFEYCHIPVILLTAKSAVESHIDGYNSGADGYITKPFNLQLLLAQINNQIKKLEHRGDDFRSQMVFEVEKLDYTSMDEKFMRQAMECVNKHIDNCEFSQSDFITEMNMSRSVLTDKIKSLTGLTPNAFIIDIRLRAAYNLLEQQQKMRIADLAFASGFNDPKYFSTCFKKKFGYSPKEFINRLNIKGEKIG